MTILAGTSQDVREQLKCRTGGHKLKELLDRDSFVIEELFLLAPDEGEEDNRTQIAIRVDNVYYKGISERVVKAGAEIIDWVMSTPPDADTTITARLTKSAGRYGVFDLELL